MEKLPNIGQDFIEQKYPDTADNKRPRKPVEERFKRIEENPKALQKLEDLLLNDFVLDVSDEETLLKLAKSLHESEKRIAIERGQTNEIQELEQNDSDLIEKYKSAILEKEQIQRRTLKSWFEYIKQNDAEYPMWFRYYVVRSLRNLGQFSRDEKTYSNRTSDTIAPFPEMNAEALAFVHKSLEHEFEKEGFTPEITEVLLTPEEEEEIKSKVPDESKLPFAIKGRLKNKRAEARKEQKQEFESEKDSEFVSNIQLNEAKKEELSKELIARLKTKDFSKLYSFAQIECAGNLDRTSLEGEWIKYDKGSDFTKLEEGLKGKGTGWCTAEGSAKGQIADGDFYVFYTKNKAGISTEPRIAIRMQEDKIGEIRGVNTRQELEPELVETAKEKYKDLPGAQKYEKADHDMKEMTKLHEKSFSIDKETKEKTYLNPELSKEDLEFLYELNSSIEGFGYDKDPRIEEIINQRNIKEDLSSLHDCKPEQISTTKEEASSGDIVYHYGILDLSNFSSAEGLTLPDSIGGNIYLSNLTSAEGLTLPNSIGGNIYLSNLTSAEGLTLPNSIGGNIYLSNLTSAEGLTLPDSIGGNLILNRLTSAEGLTLPDSIGGGLHLNNLSSAEGLTLPNSIGGGLYLSSLTSAEGLTLPDSIGGDLHLNNLTSAEGLTLPNSIGGGLYLSSLTSAEGLTLPNSIGGDLNLHNLTSAEGLTLPNSIGGGLYLSSLTSAEGLTLPDSIGGGLHLNNLTSAEKQKLREKYPQHREKI